MELRINRVRINRARPVVDRISKTTLFYACLCDMELMKNNEIEYNRHRQTKSLFLVRSTLVSKCQKFVPFENVTVMVAETPSPFSVERIATRQIIG